ncbi:putative membrane protein [Vibrio vulnificus]|nr:putative membrane protein [Vibrio vulnificus]
MDTLCLFNDIFLRMAISFLLEAAAVLAATSSGLGIILYFVAKIKTAAQGDGFIRHCLRRLSGVFC